MRLWIVFAILGFGLVVLFMNNDSGRSFGLDNDDFGRFITLLPFAALLSVGILASNRLGQTLRYLSWWVLIALGLVAGYLYRGDLQGFGDRMLAGLAPGRAVVSMSEAGNEIILHRARNGHFATGVDVNGTSIPMLVDTGASTIALSYEDARRVGIDVANLEFNRMISTANGRTMGASVRLDEVAIGPIRRERISAIVGQPGSLDGSLLGMSFLSTLSSLQIRTDELRLTD